MGTPVLKGLISTHHFFRWAGSELVAFELLEELAARGHDMTLYCPFVDFALIRAADDMGFPIIFDPTRLELAEFDFVIANHQTPSRFLAHQPDETLFGAARPVFVYSHLSPFEPFEMPGPFCEIEFADILLCNSPETARALADLAPELGAPRLFQNPAPKRFERPPPPPCEKLRRLLIVSNHMPKELYETVEILRAQDVEITHIGSPENNRRLQPNDLWEHDAVVTIGKTVPYALRAQTPVFLYDCFQGPGWLTAQNFDAAEDRNFSGRCHQISRSPDEISNEILAGFAAAQEFAAQVKKRDLTAFQLEDQVTQLLAAINECLGQRAQTHTPFPKPTKIKKIRRAIAREANSYDLVDREIARARARDPNLTFVTDSQDLGPAYPIEARILRPPVSGKAMVIAAFSYRYDVHLVPGLLENLAPAIHGWVAWDDRQADAAFTGDANRQAALHDAATRLGADWILATDPDERFEPGLAARIDDLTNNHGPLCWTFNCREMFTPTQYRVDGLWRDKHRVRLFPCLPGMQPEGKELHGSWTQNAARLPKRATGLDFYHLRMATPERRQHRRDLYAAADPERKFQALGYDYLCDERGMELREIAEGRHYSPVFVEDGGLWAPPLAQIGDPRPDPLAARLNWATNSLLRNGRVGAFHGVEDALDPEYSDPDLVLLAANLALEAEKPHDAIRLCGKLHANAETQALTQIVESRAKLAIGDQPGALVAAQTAIGLAPQSITALRQGIAARAPHDRFAHPQAAWRKWAPNASLHQGNNIATSQMAVVVLGLGAPRELAQAVGSLRAQDPCPEIVVVNSGGGNARAVLREHLDFIRLIELPQQVFPGHARNIGIDASAAPFVGFLASDCRARAGWVARRCERHNAGVDVVASSVVPDAPKNIYVEISSAYQHWTRWPDAPPEHRGLYGRSYRRHLFDKYGYFPTGLRVAEDTYFNKLLAPDTQIDWAPDVQTEHIYPKSFVALAVDMFKRGYRRADHEPFSSLATPVELRRFVFEWVRHKNRTTHAAILRSNAPGAKREKSIVLALRLTSRADVLGILWRARQSFRIKSIRARAQTAQTSQKSVALHKRAVAKMPWHAGGQIAYADHLIDNDGNAPDQIIAALARAFEMDPKNPKSLLKMIPIQERHAGPQKAFETVDHACFVAPTTQAFWWERHRIALGLGNLGEALFSLHRLLALRPDDPEIHQEIAALQIQLGTAPSGANQPALVAQEHA